MRGKKNVNWGVTESEDHYKFLIENSLVGICIIQNSKIKFANPFLLRALGYSLEELKNMNFCDVVTPEYREMVKERKIKREKGEEVPDRYQVAVLRKNGEKFETELQARRIKHKGHPAVMCIVIDAPKMGKTMQKFSTLRELTSILAHEARTPLHSISSAAEQLLLRKGKKLENEDVELLDLINKQSQKLSNILGDFLAYVKPEDLSLEKVNINQLSKEVVESLSKEMKSKNIILEENLDQDLGEIKADSERIIQVVSNVLLNAVQFLPQGGKITLSTKGEKGKIKITISDTGGGIPQKNLKLIFSPFYSTREEGTGLGLSIADRIVRAHGGNIQVETEPGKGSSFIINLPKK
jgi:PAS domain S-box-containing protein